MDSPYNLPNSENLDIAIFSRLLDDTATSYKFLFFLSLLDILSSRFFKATSPILLKDLAIEMLVNAWYPHSVFRLSFGLQDMVADKLDALELNFDKSLLKITEGNKIIVREAIKKKNIDDTLTRYVPFRLIRPFFKELRGLKDQQVNNEIKIAAENLFETRKPSWSFVAHDQLWNLIPVPKSVNSSKSDKIPDDIYFENFVKTQHLGLIISHSHISQKKWNHYIESYLVDLGFSRQEDLLSFESLKKQYEIKFKPLIALATSQGFESNWRYL